MPDPDPQHQRGFDIGRVQSCVLRFQNIDPPPPSPPGECVLPPPLPQQRCGGYTLTGRKGGLGPGGSIFLKTKGIGLASYSHNLSTRNTDFENKNLAIWSLLFFHHIRSSPDQLVVPSPHANLYNIQFIHA
jgi:hypothetical protein